MCIRLENNGHIIIPGSYAPVKTGNQIDNLKWGIDLGHGVMFNARIESIMANKWEKYGLTIIGELEVTAFFEKNHRFKFLKPFNVGVLHNASHFLVITERATDQVKKVHDRQPCYLNLFKLLKTA